MRKTTDAARSHASSAGPEAQIGYRVRGRVQGVGFRWWTRTQAVRLGLVGTVQNRADGSVEVWVGGDPARISALRQLLERGPPGAVVEEVESLPPRTPPRTNGFQIAR